MAEIEKSLIKEQYSRIGKNEENGVIVEDDQDQVTKWLEKKTSLIYDFEDDTLNFGRGKPTDWNTNKRVHLPKSGSSSLETFLEVRRMEASRLYDECKTLLGDGKEDKKGFENLRAGEKQGLSSLQK